MLNRRVGYCKNCNSNVLHVRAFESRLAYGLDRMTFGVMGYLRLGPWRCVDCGFSRMMIARRRDQVRVISETTEKTDHEKPVKNFLRTDQSLAHATENSDRYSQKFRFGIVEKLLLGKATISQCCADLDISELQLQMWIRDFVNHQLTKPGPQSTAASIPENGHMADGHNDSNQPWSIDDARTGLVIDSSATRKPK